VLSFSVISDDLTLSSKDENMFCIVNCKEDYDHLKLACKPIFQKIKTLYEKASIEIEGKHFNLSVLFTSGAITFYEDNNMLSALMWFLWTLYHGQE
jgi:hypothetical protein